MNEEEIVERYENGERDARLPWCYRVWYRYSGDDPACQPYAQLVDAFSPMEARQAVHARLDGITVVRVENLDTQEIER